MAERLPLVLEEQPRPLRTEPGAVCPDCGAEALLDGRGEPVWTVYAGVNVHAREVADWQIDRSGQVFRPEWLRRPPEEGGDSHQADALAYTVNTPANPSPPLTLEALARTFAEFNEWTGRPLRSTNLAGQCRSGMSDAEYREGLARTRHFLRQMQPITQAYAEVLARVALYSPPAPIYVENPEESVQRLHARLNLPRAEKAAARYDARWLAARLLSGAREARELEDEYRTLRLEQGLGECLQPLGLGFIGPTNWLWGQGFPEL